MKKILIAVDGSEFSEKAFKHSLAEAKKREDSITILQVVPGFGLAGVVPEKGREDEIKNAEEFTEKLKAEAEEEGVNVDAEVITGENIANSIVKFADDANYDLIVVGSRGKSDLP